MYNNAIKILNIIEENGFNAYIIGGYPRNRYLGIDSSDIDICTNAKPKDLKKIFKNFKISNEQYGSITIFVNNYSYEITTFRKEINYINNRKPNEFIYIDDINEDLKRRDFTINTICIDKNGNIIDKLNAKKDMNKKIIKMIGDPDFKLNQDCLRILRAIRFATTLNFQIDKTLLESIKKNGYLLKELSYFRKKQELDKIFSNKNCEYGIQLIKRCNLDKYLDINLDNIVYIDDLLGIWSQIKPKNYEFSKNEKILLNKINEAKNKDILNNNILYQYGLYVCSIVASIRNIDKTLITKKYNNLKIHNSKEIKITIPLICKLFDKDINSSKKIFKEIERKIINNELNNNLEDIKNYIFSTII